MTDARNALLDRAYRPPASASVDASPGVDHDSIVARLAIAWLVAMLLLQAMSTGLLEWELFDPELGGTMDGHAFILAMHAAGHATLVLPLAMGIASTLVLRKAANRPRTAMPELGYVGVAGWVIASLVAAGVPIRERSYTFFDPTPPVVSPGFVVFAALSCGLAAIAVNVVCTLWTQRRDPDVRRNPLALGLGVGAVLQLLAFVRSTVHAVGTWVGMPTLGSGLVTLDSLVYPVGFGLAFGLLERRDRERKWIGLAMVAAGGYDFLPGPGWDALLPTFGGALAATGLVRFAIRGPRTAAGWCACGALLSLGMLALVEGFLMALSVDVHLHDTVFVSLRPHLAGWAMLLALLGWALRERAPRGRLTTVAVMGLTGAALSAFIGLGVVGQRGMPSRYAAYLDTFTSMHRFVAMSGAAMLAFVVVVLGILARRPGPSPADRRAPPDTDVSG